MRRALRTILIVLSLIVLLIGTLAAGLLIYRPSDEWIGFAQSAFDAEARARIDPRSSWLPLNASRILYYEKGFTDYTAWFAFSADKEFLKGFIASECGKKIEELDDYPKKPIPGQAIAVERDPQPISPPARDYWRNKGYWDIDRLSKVKVFVRHEDRHSLYLFIDTERWRVYYNRSHW